MACCPVDDCLIAIVGEEIEDPDLDRYKAILKTLEDKWTESFTCSFPMTTAMKTWRFESRDDYAKAIQKYIAHVQDKIAELESVVYVRVKSGACCSPRCVCPPKAY